MPMKVTIVAMVVVTVVVAGTEVYGAEPSFCSYLFLTRKPAYRGLSREWDDGGFVQVVTFFWV